MEKEDLRKGDLKSWMGAERSFSDSPESPNLNRSQSKVHSLLLLWPLMKLERGFISNPSLRESVPCSPRTTSYTAPDPWA